MSVIPIVMAADENYAMLMCIAAESALLAKAPDTDLVFYLLAPEILPDKVLGWFDELIIKYPGTAAEWVVMEKSLFRNVTISTSYTSHITTPAYYRLMIADLLPQHKRCIYLDCDIIVCNDLTELYSSDLEDNYIAGVNIYDYMISLPERGEIHRKRTGLPSLDKYVNSGVLVMDLEMLRKYGITEKFMELTTIDYPFHDNDIINIVYYEYMAFLHQKYNYMPYATQLYEKNESAVDPTIVHFAGVATGWGALDRIEGSYVQLWWKSALCSVCADEAWERLIKLLQPEQLVLSNDFFVMRREHGNHVLDYIFQVGDDADFIIANHENVYASYHWFREDMSVYQWDYNREKIVGNRAGISICPPEEPGVYHLGIDIVEEGVRWFSDSGLLEMKPIKVMVL